MSDTSTGPAASSPGSPDSPGTAVAKPAVDGNVVGSSAFSVYGGGLWRALSPLVFSAVVAIIAWAAFLKIFAINTLIGKSPLAVWNFLVTDGDAAENRTEIFDPLLITLRDAAYGFVGGLIAAIGVAALFVLFRSLEQALMPVAMLLRSVPLVAMTPIIVLIFGRGLVGVAVIAGIVVFFPALVTIVFGLRSINPQARDLVVAYGGNDWTVLAKIAFPTALPSIFAAARISVPGALIGALVSEWLATGEGTGGQIIRDIPSFQYTNVWAAIAALTSVSIILYTLVGLIEAFVLARFGPAPTPR